MQSATIETRGPGGSVITRQLSTSEDGDVFDPETGEVYGVTDPRTDAVVWLREWEGMPDQAEPFKVRDRDAAEWVLGLFMQEELALAAIESEKAALLANLEGRAVQHRNTLKGLQWRFGRDLEEFAAAELARPGAKGKTVRLTRGSLGFRSTKGRSEIVDMPAAVAFVEEWAPAQLRKSATIEGIRVAIDSARECVGEDPETSDFFKPGEPAERFAIETGVGAK